jgi:hypothetical protein
VAPTGATQFERGVDGHPPTAVAETAEGHAHQHFGYVAVGHPADTHGTHEEFEIPCDAEAWIVTAEFFIDAATHGERRVRRHQASNEVLGAEPGCDVVSVDLAKVFGVRHHELGEHHTKRWVDEFTRDPRDHRTVLINVARVQAEHDLAGCEGDSSIQGLVHPRVARRHHLGDVSSLALNDLQRVVGRGAIDDDVFDVGVVLRPDRPKGVADHP